MYLCSPGVASDVRQVRRGRTVLVRRLLDRGRCIRRHRPRTVRPFGQCGTLLGSASSQHFRVPTTLEPQPSRRSFGM